MAREGSLPGALKLRRRVLFSRRQMEEYLAGRKPTA
jgi:hypothetical protein